MNLPISFRQNQSILTLSKRLQNLRSAFALAISEIQANIKTVQIALGTLPSDLINTIKILTKEIETSFIPVEEFPDFELGLVSLSDFVPDDVLRFYNGIRQLELAYSQLVALQIVNQKLPVKNANPGNVESDVYFKTLSDREFGGVGGYANPTIEIEQNYSYYKILQNDTLPDIARKVYNGDYTKWVLIAEANNITENDLISKNFIGQTLRIPNDEGAFLQTPENQVDEKPPIEFNDKNLEKYLYGSDLKIKNKKLQISGNGDLDKVIGVDCLIQNLQSNIQIPLGGLNPMQPGLGVEKLDDTKQSLFIVQLDRYLSQIEGQLERDPRVLSATIDRRELENRQDTLIAPVIVTPIGGQSRPIRTNLEF
jgi:LysM repeat protein